MAVWKPDALEVPSGLLCHSQTWGKQHMQQASDEKLKVFLRAQAPCRAEFIMIGSCRKLHHVFSVLSLTPDNFPMDCTLISKRCS